MAEMQRQLDEQKATNESLIKAYETNREALLWKLNWLTDKLTASEERRQKLREALENIMRDNECYDARAALEADDQNNEKIAMEER